MIDLTVQQETDLVASQALLSQREVQRLESSKFFFVVWTTVSLKSVRLRLYSFL